MYWAKLHFLPFSTEYVLAKWQGMNTLSKEKKVEILKLLVEGNTLRGVSRIVDCSINTVTKLLVDVGKACHEYQQRELRNLPCKIIQVDEIWSFVHTKDKNLQEPTDDRGSVWTWTAICADTRLVPCWHVGARTNASAYEFMLDLSSRLKHKPTIISDGLEGYEDAVERIYGAAVNYARLEKQYKGSRYVGAKKQVVTGKVDEKLISTSYVERQNLTMRMGISRFARRTDAFSKKVDNHKHAIALHFMYYNFCRIHKTLRVTPAMEAGIANTVWNVEQLL